MIKRVRVFNVSGALPLARRMMHTFSHFYPKRSLEPHILPHRVKSSGLWAVAIDRLSKCSDGLFLYGIVPFAGKVRC